MPYPLCLHHAIYHFSGKVNMSAGKTLDLRIQGVLPGVAPDTLEVRVQSHTLTPLPLWLRAYAHVSSYLCPTVHCDGDTCVVHQVPWTDGTLVCASALIDFESWTLQLPYLPPVSLTSLIGFSPVHVVIQQGEREFGRIVVQRRQHCVHMNH